MDRRALLIDFEIVEKALRTFSVTIVNGGKRLFEEKRVRSLKETARSNTFEAEVTEKGKVHAVTLSYGGSSWNLLCTCPLGTECIHVYAALLSLSKRFRKKAVVSEKNTQTAGQRDNYFALMQTPADLTENETDWVERLEAVYQSHVEGSQINGRVLKGLFPKWPDDEYWSEIKIAPRKELSRAQFWHFMIASLRRRGLTIPLLFGDWNNTDDSEHLIEAWRTEQSVSNGPRNTNATMNRPFASAARPISAGPLTGRTFAFRLRARAKRNTYPSARPNSNGWQPIGVRAGCTYPANGCPCCCSIFLQTDFNLLPA
jgi:hypothetical protein